MVSTFFYQTHAHTTAAATFLTKIKTILLRVEKRLNSSQVIVHTTTRTSLLFLSVCYVTLLPIGGVPFHLSCSLFHHIPTKEGSNCYRYVKLHGIIWYTIQPMESCAMFYIVYRFFLICYAHNNYRMFLFYIIIICKMNWF